MSIYDSLNAEQRRACCQTEGPVLILAGAGSGKTRVITHRIAWLMEECDVAPWNILAITFTNKAAGEMRERVDRLIGFGAQSVWISTFHSMCVRILRRHIDQIGYDGSFTIYDTDDQKALIRQICKQLNIDTKQIKERSILAAISAAKNELQTAGEYQDTHQKSPFEKAVGKVFPEYERRKKENNALDFDDLLVKTVDLFREKEDVLRQYQERFRYIMVDEYQDTNRAQFEIVKLLAAGYRNLCVVGDDDQSIYKFRGADIRNILDFEKVYPDACVVRLEQNYRSTQNVLDAANAVISHNVNRKVKRLWTDQGAGSLIHFREFGSGPEEAAFIAGDIVSRMRQDHRLSYRDFAILYRTNAQSRLLEDRLVLQSIPYNIVGGHNFYDRMEVRDLLSYLRTVSNGRDDISAQRIINVPRRGIGATTISRIAQIAAERGIGFCEVLERSREFPELSRADKKLQPFVQLILRLRSYAREHTVEELIKKVVEEIDYEGYLREYDELSAEDRIGNVGELISKAAAWEEDVQQSEDADASLSGFLEEVSLVADIDQVGESDDRVLLMTLHSAKGLEFPVVYMAGMEDGLFPSGMSVNSGDPSALEEERRLAYVGITRARKELTLTAARGRMIRGEIVYNPVSRFVDEIPPGLLDEEPAGSARAFRDEEEGDTPPWEKRTSSGKGYGPTSYSAGSYGGGRILSGAGASRSGTGYGTQGACSDGSGRSAASVRPKATYRKPHTKSEAQPFLAGRTGLDSLQKGAPAGEKPAYGPGDRVLHVKYGEGTVESVEPGPKDYKVKVNFDAAGPKVMYAAFARLQRI